MFLLNLGHFDKCIHEIVISNELVLLNKMLTAGDIVLNFTICFQQR